MLHIVKNRGETDWLPLCERPMKKRDSIGIPEVVIRGDMQGVCKRCLRAYQKQQAEKRKGFGGLVRKILKRR